MHVIESKGMWISERNFPGTNTNYVALVVRDPESDYQIKHTFHILEALLDHMAQVLNLKTSASDFPTLLYR